MGPESMPAAEADIPADLVRRLIADQHPDLAGRPVEVLANGWDNLICRPAATPPSARPTTRRADRP